jgi:type IX secretion system PorP/SprF family membrane protein
MDTVKAAVISYFINRQMPGQARTIFLILGLACAIATAHAQDRYFTQFYAAPLEVNPALSGAVDGSYRVSLIYHDQWQGILDNPYQTYGVFGDLKFDVGSRSKDFAGAGIAVVADRNGVFNFNTNQISLSGAYHKLLNDRNKQYLSAGFSLGIIQRSVNYEGLIFDDQFNGLDQYNFGTREDLPENNLAHADIGIGLNYSVTPSKTMGFSAGLAIAHIVSPSISFFRTTDGNDMAEDIKLKQRLTAYANLDLGVNEKLRVMPRMAFYSQGKALMLQAGAHARIDINKHSDNALNLGAGIRFAKELDQIKPASLMALTGIELGSFLMGFSYEYSLDDLASDRLGQGILEFSITFIGEYENTDNFCPKF